MKQLLTASGAVLKCGVRDSNTKGWKLYKIFDLLKIIFYFMTLFVLPIRLSKQRNEIPNLRKLKITGEF